MILAYYSILLKIIQIVSCVNFSAMQKNILIYKIYKRYICTVHSVMQQIETIENIILESFYSHSQPVISRHNSSAYLQFYFGKNMLIDGTIDYGCFKTYVYDCNRGIIDNGWIDHINSKLKKGRIEFNPHPNKCVKDDALYFTYIDEITSTNYALSFVNVNEIMVAML